MKGGEWRRLVRVDGESGSSRFVVLRACDGWLDVWSGALGKAGGVRSREVKDEDEALAAVCRKYKNKGFVAPVEPEALVATLPGLSAKQRARGIETLTRAWPSEKKLRAARESGSIRRKLSRKLLLAAYEPTLDRIASLLADGADPDYVATSGESVFFAILYHGLETVDVDVLPMLDALAAAGMSVARPLFEDGGNALFALMGQSGSSDQRRRLLKWLLGQGCDVNAPTDVGQRPLHAWAAQGPTDRAFFDVMIAAGADVNALDEDGRPPMHVAFPDHSFALRGADADAERRAMWLLEAGARVDIRCDHEQTARTLAKRQRRMGHAWLAFEAELEKSNAPGAPEGWDEFLDLLIKLRRPARLRAEATNLSDAAAQGDLELVERFLQDGADPDFSWREGYYPMERALARGDGAMAELLRRYGAAERSAPRVDEGKHALGKSLRGLAAAEVRQKNRGVVRNTKERDALVARADALALRDPHHAAHLRVSNVSAFHHCCANGLDRLVRRFLEAGVDANGRSTREQGHLFSAACRGASVETIELFLEHGADPNTLGSDGRGVPILSAVQRGEARIVKLLLDAGAEPMNRGDWASTPINAAKGPERNAIRRLLRAAARPAVEKSRRSPLKFRRRKRMYDPSSLIGVKEYDAYYPASCFGVIQATLDATVEALASTLGIEERRAGTGGRAIPAKERALFVFSTTEAPEYTFLANASAHPGRFAYGIEHAAADLGVKHLVREFRGEYRWAPAGPDHPQTQFFSRAKLWVPPFYVSGEGIYDPGDQHLLEFKGITKDAITQAAYLVLSPEDDEGRARRLEASKVAIEKRGETTGRFGDKLASLVVRATGGGTRLKRIGVIDAPDPLSSLTATKFQQVEASAFLPLGWLEAEMFSPMWLAGWVSPDGRTVALITGVAAVPFSAAVTDCVSWLEDGRCVTTNNMLSATSFPEKGLLKFGEGLVPFAELYRRHRAHVEDLGSAPATAPSSAEQLANAIHEYVARQTS